MYSVLVNLATTKHSRGDNLASVALVSTHVYTQELDRSGHAQTESTTHVHAWSVRLQHICANEQRPVLQML